LYRLLMQSLKNQSHFGCCELDEVSFCLDGATIFKRPQLETDCKNFSVTSRVTLVPLFGSKIYHLETTSFIFNFYFIFHLPNCVL
jgi:hypothetical protein